MIDKNYYYPSVEDIRIGYECEINWSKGYSDEFTPYVINVKEPNGAYTNTISEVVNAIDDGYAEVRVPLLTKEQIEAEGWYESYEDFYRKGVWKMQKLDTVIIIRKNAWYPEETAYRGICPTINEFRTICKLLKITNNEDSKT